MSAPKRLVESGDSWLLPLDGFQVSRCCLDFGFVINIDVDGEFFEIRIGATLQLKPGEAGEVLWTDPESDPAGTAPAFRLVHETVTRAVAHKDGALEMWFSDGSRLWVDPDPDYEAWTAVGPGGLRLVSMPGGELAIWQPE